MINFINFLIPLVYAAEADVKIVTSIPGVTENSPQGIVSGFYTFALMIGGLLAFAAIVYGGIRYTLAAGDTSSQSDARDRITQALVGLLLLLGAFIVLYTVNPNLTNLGLPTLDNPQVPEGGGGTGRPPAESGLGLSDQAARAQLAARGIDTKIARTSLAGIKQGTLDEAIRIKSACNCDFMVTGGTEDIGVHSSEGEFNHLTGYKIDLSPNATLDAYITSNPNLFSFIGYRTKNGVPTNVPLYKNVASGAIYARESNHWDVQVKP